MAWYRRRSHKEIALRSQIVTVAAVQDLHVNPALSVRYGSQQISNLNVSTILLWNAGKQPIRQQNIASTDRLRVVFPNGTKILESSVLLQASPAIATQVTPIYEALLLEFEFLNPLDPIVLHCLHTGPVEEVEIRGQLVGSSVALDSDWDSQFGIHGLSDDTGWQAVRIGRLTVLSNIVTWAQVSILVAAFFFDSWAIVISLASALALVSVLSLLLSTSSIPRVVRRRVKVLQEEAEEEKKNPPNADTVGQST